jgi:hypothetical protein
MKRAAINKIINVMKRGLGTLPIAEQIEIYDALALVMPTKSERKDAKHVAWILREAEKHQLDFNRQLFRELQWPGHQHGGLPAAGSGAAREKGNGGGK